MQTQKITRNATVHITKRFGELRAAKAEQIAKDRSTKDIPISVYSNCHFEADGFFVPTEKQVNVQKLLKLAFAGQNPNSGCYYNPEEEDFQETLNTAGARAAKKFKQACDDVCDACRLDLAEYDVLAEELQDRAMLGSPAEAMEAIAYLKATLA